MSKKFFKWLPRKARVAIKFALTIIALTFVAQKISTETLVSLMHKSQMGYVFLGLVLFNLSQIISSERLQQFFFQYEISRQRQLKLYYLGMFYNLFLPGGIGGDGYKIYFFRQTYAIKAKRSFIILFTDRLAGLFGLLIGLILTFMILDVPLFASGNFAITVIAFFISLVLAGLIFAISRHSLRMPTPKFIAVLCMGLIVQGCQLAAAWAILFAMQPSLGVESFFLYGFIFLLSSLAATIPISIGGVGLRELCISLMAGYFPIHLETAVGLTLWFFILSVVSSLMGAWFSLGDRSHSQNLNRTQADA